MLKFLPEPIVLSDEGLIIYANKAAIDLVNANSDKEIIGKSILDFIHPDHHLKSLQILKQVMESDEASIFARKQIYCVTGELLETEVSSIQIHNYNGKPVVLSAIRDITERKHEEELLVRSEKLSVIGQLVAGVAHEIRNPLTTLKGFTHLLKSRLADQAYYFDIMEDEIDRINLIVNEFMTLAKPHINQRKQENMFDILHSVIAITETQATMMNVSIVRDFAEYIPFVYCDENQLKQVFINIIKNSIEAMPDGGEVSISMKKTNLNNVLITIKDRGVGIPNSILLQIGEPFYTTKEKGVGLGLMICHRIVEWHDGHIEISSKINLGTTVDVFLPIS